MDHVDSILKQWQNERADLDVSSMEITGRVKRLSLIFNREMETTLSRFGLNTASFDVLATLRRAGAPYTLSPGDLIASSMVTSGTMTNRLDQLEKAGWIIRKQSQNDKRSFLISLTKTGLALIDQAVEKHVDTLDNLTQMLSQQDRSSLNKILRKMALYFEGNPKKG